MTVLNTTLFPLAASIVAIERKQEEVKARLREFSFIAGFTIENEAQEILWKAGASHDQIKKAKSLNITVGQAYLVAPYITRQLRWEL